MPERLFYCFDEYRLDAQTRALYRGEDLIRLEPKIADMLLYLVVRHGLVVSKDELMENIWPGTIVEETAIRRNISLMRSTLDPKDMDRFIETLPRQGYRFCAVVRSQTQETIRIIGDQRGSSLLEEQSPNVAAQLKATLDGNKSSAESLATNTRNYRNTLLWMNLFFLVLVILASLYWFEIKPRWIQSTVVSRQLTTNSEDLPILAAAISPNGSMIAFADETQLYVSDTTTVERHVLPLPKNVVPRFLEWMPDNIHLLVSSVNPETHDSALWSIPVLGGNAELLIHNAHMGVASANGQQIVFVRNENQLWLSDINGSNERLFATAPQGSTFNPRPQFSSDGHYVLDNRYSMESSRWRIEVRSIKTGATSTLYESDQFLADFRLISNHELLMSQQLGRGSNSSQLLTATVNLETGSRSVTHVVTTSPDGLQAIFNSTRDGKTLVAITGRFFSAIYIADLGEDQVTMSHIRRLTLNDSHSLPAGWLSDSETVLMFSNRAGHYGIFQQAIDSPDARAIVSGDHDYVRPVVSADGKWLFYFMAGDVSRQQAFSKKTLMRQAMSGGIPQEIDTKSDFYRSMRCAVTVNRCVLSEREGDFIVFYQFDPEKGRGAEWFRAKWSPTVTGFFWDLSHDGTRIAYIDTASGSNDIGIETQSDDKTTKAQLHLDGYDPFATLYWDGTGKGFYVSSYNSNGDVLKLLHVGMDGKVAVLRQQISTQLSWAIPSPNGKHLAFQKFARKSNIWLLKRQ